MATKKRAAKTTPKAAAGSAAPPLQPAPMPGSDPQKKPFVPEVLDRTAIAIPLLKDLKAEDEAIAKGETTERNPTPSLSRF